MQQQQQPWYHTDAAVSGSAQQPQDHTAAAVAGSAQQPQDHTAAAVAGSAQQLQYHTADTVAGSAQQLQYHTAAAVTGYAQQLQYQIAAAIAGSAQQPQYHTAAAVGGSAQQPTSSDEIRTLWIGDLPYWVDENYLRTCFASTGYIVNVKVIRNKLTVQHEGYGFIEFGSRATAERVLMTYNGLPLPYAFQKFRLNWANFGAGERPSDHDSSDFPIFVGDLGGDVTDYVLEETFRTRYPSVKGARVVMDRNTGHSKGYGFVTFGDATEQSRAMTEMNGKFCSTRPMRIAPATNANKTMGIPSSSPESDLNNTTTVFVGGLDSSVTVDVLKQLFTQYGEVLHVKIPSGKPFGFVKFALRSSAEDAIKNLHGTLLRTNRIRLSWGRGSNNQPGNNQPGNNQPGNNNTWYYGGFPAVPPQYPHMMYAYGGHPPGLPAYGNYQQQQQQQQ